MNCEGTFCILQDHALVESMLLEILLLNILFAHDLHGVKLVVAFELYQEDFTKGAFAK
jgi:hypothetical protein